ncbi:capsid protein [Capybara genomovirus 6]|uniref:Capsid protein n=1 Tax=Capybara genomovirus 6 TaxID=2582945 RepID=A0A4P8W4I3_9VIRU|nr:capsid protein [Capybara genomovirus 6]QCS35892.1 capsid protein [Capybara genomovirus 6]
MAYSTKSRYPRRALRRYVRKPRTTRRTYAKVRPYRRVLVRKRPPMTKRRILDVTTVKKRDNMPCYSNMAASGPTTTFAITPAVIRPTTSSDPLQNHPIVMPWLATARDLTTSTGVINARAVENARTTTTPYMVGLREIVEIQTPTGTPWQWRRICFTYKGLLPGVEQTTLYRPFAETSNGYMRVASPLAGDRNSDATYRLFYLIFAGQNATDWMDPMTAKLDVTRISVKYDKTRTIAAGNESGTIRKYKHWHAMGKTLAYDDDENGENMITNYTSVDSKVGMGDYYVVDLFRSRFGANSAEYLLFNPSATLYWHEK